MIQSWRTSPGSRGTSRPLPGAARQLPGLPKDQPGDSSWAELRASPGHRHQGILLNVSAACIIDIDAEKDIHPKDKQNVASCLARLALNRDYNRKDVVPHGPLYQSSGGQAEDRRVIKFDVAGSKLIPSTTASRLSRASRSPGEDKARKWAEAKITGPGHDQSQEQRRPRPEGGPRYNWADNPSGTLYNEPTSRPTRSNRRLERRHRRRQVGHQQAKSRISRPACVSTRRGRVHFRSVRA